MQFSESTSRCLLFSICSGNSIFGDIEAQKLSKNAKNSKNRLNWRFHNFLLKIDRFDLFLNMGPDRGTLEVSPEKKLFLSPR